MTRPKAPPLSTDSVRWLHRIVQLGLLASLLWKHRFFRAAGAVYLEIPLADDFFPAAWQSGPAAVFAFEIVAVACGVNFFVGARWIQVALSTITLGGVSFLCVHQATYNDATFTTLWWTSVWAWWLVWRRGIDDADDLIRKAAFLSRLMVSMILLGGAVGKWTAEYWSGEVLHDIYFVDRDFWLFNALRDRFNASQLRDMATHYSRMVVIGETVMGACLWRLPPRVAATVGVSMLASIALLSNFLLFSVMSCLMAMLASGWWVKKK